MRGGKNTQGYTILEVMIFLAISGMMFGMAAAFVSGKQASAQFKQGMNSMNSEVQQVINDVANGFYPSVSNFPCHTADTGRPQFTGTAAEQGGNQGCVFLGKIMQFSVDHDASSYNVFSIAGRQNVGNANTDAPSTFAGAIPTVVPTLIQSKTIDWGLQITGMFSGPVASGNSVGAVGFFGSFNGSSRGSSQTVQAVVIPNSHPGQTTSEMTGVINDSGEPVALDNEADHNANITICLRDGNRFGSLTIGGVNNQRLTTSIRIDNSAAGVGCP